MQEEIVALLAAFTSHEIEARAGVLTNGRFAPGVSPEHYARLARLADVHPSTRETATDVFLRDGTRVTLETGAAMHKTSAKKLDFANVRLSAARETPVELTPAQLAEARQPGLFQRRKERLIVALNRELELHLTRVNGAALEAEIEIVRKGSPRRVAADMAYWIERLF